MDPATQNIILGIAGALVAYFAGHFHVILPVKPKDPNATPAQPVVPPPNPFVPILPTTVRPIGQGGLLDLASILMSNILASAASQESKLASIQKIGEATQLVLSPPVKSS